MTCFAYEMLSKSKYPLNFSRDGVLYLRVKKGQLSQIPPTCPLPARFSEVVCSSLFALDHGLGSEKNVSEQQGGRGESPLGREATAFHSGLKHTAFKKTPYVRLLQYQCRTTRAASRDEVSWILISKAECENCRMHGASPSPSRPALCCAA